MAPGAQVITFERVECPIRSVSGFVRLALAAFFIILSRNGHIMVLLCNWSMCSFLQWRSSVLRSGGATRDLVRDPALLFYCLD